MTSKIIHLGKIFLLALSPLHEPTKIAWNLPIQTWILSGLHWARWYPFILLLKTLGSEKSFVICPRLAGDRVRLTFRSNSKAIVPHTACLSITGYLELITASWSLLCLHVCMHRHRKLVNNLGNFQEPPFLLELKLVLDGVWTYQSSLLSVSHNWSCFLWLEKHQLIRQLI